MGTEPLELNASAHRVLHLWGNYAPDLFDRSHVLCLEAGWDSSVLARGLFESELPMPPHVQAFRRVTKAETNSSALHHRALRALSRPVNELGFCRLVRQAVRQSRPGVVHCHFGTTAAELVRWHSLPDLPTLVSFYGVDASAALREPAIVARYQALARRGAFAHVLCAAVADRLVALGWPRAHILTANLPAKVEAMPDIGPRQGQGLRLLIPARFVEKKGHLVLLQALQQIATRLPDWSLTCLGYGSPGWLKEQIQSSGLTDRVTVIDNGQSSSFVEEYIEVLRDHDLVLAPSIVSSNGDDEGGPALTVVMAQAAGKPVIVSNFPGAECSVTDGVEGLVTPGGDVDALAQAILSLGQNPQRWQAMGEAGRRRVQDEFSEAAYARQLFNMYQQVMRAHAQSRTGALLASR